MKKDLFEKLRELDCTQVRKFLEENKQSLKERYYSTLQGCNNKIILTNNGLEMLEHLTNGSTRMDCYKGDSTVIYSITSSAEIDWSSIEYMIENKITKEQQKKINEYIILKYYLDSDATQEKIEEAIVENSVDIEQVYKELFPVEHNNIMNEYIDSSVEENIDFITERVMEEVEILIDINKDSLED